MDNSPPKLTPEEIQQYELANTAINTIGHLPAAQRDAIVTGLVAAGKIVGIDFSKLRKLAIGQNDQGEPVTLPGLGRSTW